MPKILSITRSADFKTINLHGQKFFAKSLILQQNPTDNFYFKDVKNGKNADDFMRVGYTASKAVGNAVERNRAKRRLRAAASELLPLYGKMHHDYVIIARKEVVAIDYEKILADLKFCLKRISNANSGDKKA